MKFLVDAHLPPVLAGRGIMEPALPEGDIKISHCENLILRQLRRSGLLMATEF
jgi:hypothetical protein